ncbi:MAG TPA: hypothetical protein PLA88_03120 [Bacteroidales bacterium]|nr:hypothetical protein [Bacteroidales bacterium]
MRLVALASGNEITQSVLPEILKKSVLLAGHIEFFTKPGSAVTYRKAGSSSDLSGKTRTLGNAYPETVVTPNYDTAARKFIGDQVKIDVALERMGYDLRSELDAQLKRHMKDFPGLFHYQLINGDPDEDPTQFAGLKLLAPANRTIKAATNGLQLLHGNNDAARKSQQAFLEKLDEVIALCQGTNKVLLLNARTMARLNSIAREYLTIQRNEFGIPVTSYNQVPLIDLGDYQAGVNTYLPIIGFNETCGTTADKCASVYCASFEEEDGVSFASVKDGFMVYDITRVDNWLKVMYELIVDSALVRPSALSKLEGLYIDDSEPVA